MVMNAATCQALVSLFPLVMITLVLERRSTAIKLRRRKWFRDIAVWVLSASLFGLAFAISGCAVNGLSGLLGALAWVCTGVSVLGLAWTLLASMASTELLEDDARTVLRRSRPKALMGHRRHRPRMRASKHRR